MGYQLRAVPTFTMPLVTEVVFLPFACNKHLKRFITKTRECVFILSLSIWHCVHKLKQTDNRNYFPHKFSQLKLKREEQLSRKQE